MRASEGGMRDREEVGDGPLSPRRSTHARLGCATDEVGDRTQWPSHQRRLSLDKGGGRAGMMVVWSLWVGAAWWTLVGGYRQRQAHNCTFTGSNTPGLLGVRLSAPRWLSLVRCVSGRFTMFQAPAWGGLPAASSFPGQGIRRSAYPKPTHSSHTGRK
jgi:hypothetical protein